MTLFQWKYFAKVGNLKNPKVDIKVVNSHPHFHSYTISVIFTKSVIKALKNVGKFIWRQQYFGPWYRFGVLIRNFTPVSVIAIVSSLFTLNILCLLGIYETSINIYNTIIWGRTQKIIFIGNHSLFICKNTTLYNEII